MTAPWRIDWPDQGGEALAVILPGLRYDAGMPLLAMAGDEMARRGVAVARVAFSYADDAGFMGRPEAGQIRQITADGVAIMAAVAARHQGPLWLIGKSLGTISMMGRGPFDGGATHTRHIWLTPSLIGTGLAGVMARQGGFCLIGSRDPARDQAVMLHRPPHLRVAEIAGADHGWNGDGDLVARAAAALRGWLEGPESGRLS
ncbi:MAG: hypothetical protein Q4G25_11900 [Paracoccus sp. (in: a-proteobacteria)]|nr:hypothetical protein [Paracoccus sp. (in: a-proteobacteria)]